MSLTKLSLAWNNLIIPGQGELFSDIPAAEGKIANLFYSVRELRCTLTFSWYRYVNVIQIERQLCTDSYIYAIPELRHFFCNRRMPNLLSFIDVRLFSGIYYLFAPIKMWPTILEYL